LVQYVTCSFTDLVLSFPSNTLQALLALATLALQNKLALQLARSQGFDALAALLADGGAATQSPTVLRASTTSGIVTVISNALPHEGVADFFLTAGVMRPFLRALELVTKQTRGTEALAEAVTEPLCQSLLLLARNTACCSELVRLDAPRLIEAALPVLKTIGATLAASYAAEALALLGAVLPQCRNGPAAAAYDSAGRHPVSSRRKNRVRSIMRAPAVTSFEAALTRGNDAAAALHSSLYALRETLQGAPAEAVSTADAETLSGQLIYTLTEHGAMDAEIFDASLEALAVLSRRVGGACMADTFASYGNAGLHEIVSVFASPHSGSPSRTTAAGSVIVDAVASSSAAALAAIDAGAIPLLLRCCSNGADCFSAASDMTSGDSTASTAFRVIEALAMHAPGAAALTSAGGMELAAQVLLHQSGPCLHAAAHLVANATLHDATATERFLAAGGASALVELLLKANGALSKDSESAALVASVVAAMCSVASSQAGALALAAIEAASELTSALIAFAADAAIAEAACWTLALLNQWLPLAHNDSQSTVRLLAAIDLVLSSHATGSEAARRADSLIALLHHKAS
jgi:hypothetical protein